MSLVVISLTEDRALVAVDTCCTGADGRFSETPKMLLLPHANAVLAGIGAVAITQAAFSWAMRPGVNVGFDLLASTMGPALSTILEQRIRLAQDDALTAAVLNDGNLIHLVGWSAAAGRMKGLVFVHMPGAAGFTAHDTRDWYTSPLDLDHPTPKATTPDEMAAKAEAVAMFGRSTSPAMGYGTRLVIADVVRDSMATSVRMMRATT